MENVPGFEERELDFHLSLLRLKPYGDEVLEYYAETLTAHENGEDLEEHLRSVVVESPYGGSHDNQFDANAINFILGRTEPGPRVLSKRLEFAEKKSGIWSLTEKPITQQWQEYRDGFIEKGWGNSIFFALDIDPGVERGLHPLAHFNEQGQDVTKLDKVHLMMARLCIIDDQPWLAQYFTSQIFGLWEKINLYFDAMQNSNSAAYAVQNRLSVLAQELERESPVLLQWLHIGMVALQTGQVESSEVVQQVNTITDDQRYFDMSNYTSDEILALHWPEKYITVSPKGVRYELARALAWSGEYDAANVQVEQVDKLHSADSWKENAETYQARWPQELSLILACRGEVGRRDINKLKSQITSQARFMTALQLRLLGIAGAVKPGWFKNEVSADAILENDILHTVQADVKDSPKYALAARLLRMHYPDLHALIQQDCIDRLTDFVATNDIQRAQKLYSHIVGDDHARHNSSMLRLQSAVAMYQMPEQHKGLNDVHQRLDTSLLQLETLVTSPHDDTLIGNSRQYQSLHAMLIQTRQQLSNITDPDQFKIFNHRIDELERKIQAI